MQNDGSHLEQLVAAIEARLSPQGFKVETRKPVFDDNGVQIAEFDILISGTVGTGQISCLLECRDRPSEGPAPASWIEQLNGRRARFRFEKVMAVSSTGFAPGAVDAAADAGIELRELQSLTYKDVKNWLPQNAPIIVHDGRFSAVRLHIEDPESVEDRQREMPADETTLIPPEGEPLSLLELWRKLVNRSSVWQGIPQGGPAVEVTVTVADHIADSYKVAIEGRLLAVRDIEFDATLHAYFPVMPFVEAAEYSEGDGSDDRHTFARVGRWEAPEGGLIRGLTVILLKGPEDREEDS